MKIRGVLRSASSAQLGGLILGGMLILASCRAPSGARSPQRELPELRLNSILAPARGSSSLRIRELERAAAGGRVSEAIWSACVLRAAQLQLELGDPNAALEASARVERRVPPAPMRARAIAGLLRGRAHEALGQRDAARAALDSARPLASSTELRGAISDVLARLTVVQSKRRPAREARPFSVVSRATWGARPPRLQRMQAMGTPRRITIHHSALWAGTIGRKSASFVRIFQRTHMEDRGWGDIGYHWLIDRSGRILEGRSMRYQGAHAGDNASNRQNIGICLLGNFQPGRRERAQRPSVEQINSLETLVRSLAQRYRIAPSQLLTHREVHPGGLGATQCPGVWLTPFVAALRRSLGSSRLAD